MEITQENVRNALNSSDARLQQLFEEAYGLIDQHWIWVRAMERSQEKWDGKSQLQIRCVRVGNSIRLHWSKIKWIGSKAAGNRRSLRLYIKRPKNSHSYTISKLRDLACDWEADAVEALELKLAKTRREATFLVKAIGNIQNSQGIRCPIAEEDPMDEQD